MEINISEENKEGKYLIKEVETPCIKKEENKLLKNYIRTPFYVMQKRIYFDSQIFKWRRIIKNIIRYF